MRVAADIVEIASEFTALRRQGTRFTGLCPYPDHQEKTPSFSVSPDKGFSYCFGCSKGADAIKLVMDLKGLDFAEAVSYIADRSGVELQYEGGGDADAARKRAGRRKSIHKALAAAAVYYHKYLLKSQSPEAADWCVARGLGLVGIDHLSVDPVKGDDFPAHGTLLGNDVLILEGVNLRAVPPGRYTLIALPLKLHLSEGSPVRAVLVR